MSPTQIKRSYLVILLISLLAIAAWLFEILFSKGWYSLHWLSGTLYSPYLITLLVVFSFLSPFMLSKQLTVKRSILPALILYILSLLCYEGGKLVCNFMYCRFCSWTRSDVILLFGGGFFLFIVIAFSYRLVTHKLIKKVKKIHILYTGLLALAVIPCSLFTIRVNPGLSSQTNWVDAVKMGYPVFWITLLLGFAGVLMAKQKEINN